MPSFFSSRACGVTGAEGDAAATACASGVPKLIISRDSIIASRSGSAGITAHAKAAPCTLSIFVVGTCSIPRCET